MIPETKVGDVCPRSYYAHIMCPGTMVQRANTQVIGGVASAECTYCTFSMVAKVPTGQIPRPQSFNVDVVAFDDTPAPVAGGYRPRSMVH